MSKQDEFYELATDLIKADEHRDLMFVRQDRIFRCEWTLPEGTPTWIKAVKMTDGHDALRAVSRIFSAQLPNVTVWPWDDEQDVKDQADILERGLRWFLYLAMQSGQHSFLPDIVMSAARYDELTVQVLFTKHQKDLIEGFLQTNDDPKDKRVRMAKRRLDALKQEGPFQVMVRQPRFVHYSSSEYGPEAVIYTSLMTADEVVANYGLAAKEIAKIIEKKKEPENYAILDCLDYGDKLVMAIPTTKDTFPKFEGDKAPSGTITLIEEDNTLGFLPWSIKVGGTSLESSIVDRHIPMLYTQDRADQYDLQNMIASIAVSEAIARAAAPRGKKGGPGAEGIEVEYGDPQQDVTLKPGQTYEVLPAPELDKAMMELNSWIQS
jgi:hypothetical protein